MCMGSSVKWQILLSDIIFCRQKLVNLTIINFYENQFSATHVVAVDKRTYKRKLTSTYLQLFFASLPRNMFNAMNTNTVTQAIDAQPFIKLHCRTDLCLWDELRICMLLYIAAIYVENRWKCVLNSIIPVFTCNVRFVFGGPRKEHWWAA
jgi:hypothetical protein